MSVDANTYIQIKGNEEDLFKAIKFLMNNEYLNDSCTINGENTLCWHGNDIDNNIKKIIAHVIKKKKDKNTIFYDGSGPYGKFYTLDDTDIFEELAVLVPNTSFSGTMELSDSSVNCILNAEYNNYKIHFTYKSNSYDDKYMEYVHQSITYEEFCEMFKLRDYEECEFDNFFCMDYYEEGDLRELVDYSELSEELFEKEKEVLKKFNIINCNEWLEEQVEKNKKEWIYDVLTKKVVEGKAFRGIESLRNDI